MILLIGAEELVTGKAPNGIERQLREQATAFRLFPQ
jgi:hypothetical protein